MQNYIRVTRYKKYLQFCSSSLDSPAGSLQEMGPHSRHSHHGGHAQTSTTASATAASASAAAAAAAAAAATDPSSLNDSDFEAERDPPNWRVFISQDELDKLKKKERNRQDVINGTSQFFA